MKILAVAVLSLMPLVVNAEAFKCTVNGRVIYQQSPCSYVDDVPMKLDLRDTGNGEVRVYELKKMALIFLQEEKYQHFEEVMNTLYEIRLKSELALATYKELKAERIRRERNDAIRDSGNLIRHK